MQWIGMWSPLEKQKHINELELLAVYFGVKSFLPLLRGKHVCIKSDNSTTVCYLKAMGDINLLRATNFLKAFGRAAWKMIFG